MAKYITDLEVSLDGSEEQLLQSKGFMKINVDLNAGAGGNDIHLWYKRGNAHPITSIQFSFNDGTADGLSKAGYKKIDKNLNAGAGGSAIYLWFFKGSGEFHTPIVSIDVIDDTKGGVRKYRRGWERLACDLNRFAGGKWIHVWVKREKKTYICDVTATDSFTSHAELFRDGYIRVDEDTNRGANGPNVFIWYRQTTDPQRALTDLDVSTDDQEYQNLQYDLYTPVSVNLNQGNRGSTVYLWHKKDEGSDPIKAITVLLQCDAATVCTCERAGVTVIEKDLNAGNKGRREYLCVYQ